MAQDATILVVDDDERLCRLLKEYLSREGYQVITATDSTAMRRQMDRRAPDLIILDLILGNEDGLTIAREIRNERNIPIIMLTGKADVVDKVVGLELGADDYITKPYDERELLARVRSVVRRSKQRQEQTLADGAKNTAEFEGLKIDFIAHELTSSSGEEIHLTTHEFALLSALVNSANRVLNRDQLLDGIAGRDYDPLDRSVDVLVGKLRQKIEPTPANPKFIKTVRGVGYKFTSRVEFH
ncbi:MAG: response regulator [Rhodospirillales bacterium]|nr:response regulator [Rhodospirillales bacterium]